MAGYTAEQYKEAARKALAGGDAAAAKRLIDAGRALEAQGAQAPVQQPAAIPTLAPATPENDASTNPYTQDDTQYDPVTGVPIAGSFANATPTARDPAFAAAYALSQALSVGWADEGMRRIGEEMKNRAEKFNQPPPQLANAFMLAPELGKESAAAYPGIAIPTEIAGAVMVPGNIFSGGKSLLSKILAGAGTGAVGGAVYGAGAADEGEKVAGGLQGGALGAAIGGAIPAVTAAGKSILESLPFFGTNAQLARMAEGAPTTEGVKAEAQGLLNQAADMAEMVPQGPGLATLAAKVDNATDQLPGMAQRLGTIIPDSTTPQGDVISRLTADLANNPKLADTGIPPEMLKALKESASDLATDVNALGAPTRDARVGAIAAKALDDFIAELPEGTTYRQGLDAWSRYLKSRMIDRAMDKAGNYLGGETSGIRNLFKNILNNDDMSRMFRAPEADLMRRVIQGTMPEKALRMAGSGLGQLASTFSGGPVGFGLSQAARAGADAMTNRNAEIVRALIAKGGFQGVPGVSDATMQIINQILSGAARPASGRPDEIMR